MYRLVFSLLTSICKCVSYSSFYTHSEQLITRRASVRLCG